MEDRPYQSGKETRPLPEPHQKPWIERLFTPRLLILLLTLSLGLIAAAIIVGVVLLRPAPLPFTPPDSLESLAGQYPELAHILQDGKLGSVYKEFLLVYQTQGEDEAYNLAKQRGLINDRDEVCLTLELDTDDPAVVQTLISELERSKLRVTANAANLIDLAIPLDLLLSVIEAGDEQGFLRDLTGLEHVVRIRLPSTIQSKNVPLSQLSMEIESLSDIGADSWHAQGFTGQGVKVGVLDLQFDGYRSLLGRELPESVTVQCFCDGGQVDQMGGVHGTAVAEIIHDIAPDAELFLAAFRTDAEFQQAAEWLASQGVQIISNSTGTVWGPKDGTSSSNKLIDSMVNRGIVWVNSAGNAAEGHYRAKFTDRDGDGWHDQLIYFETFGRDSLALNWNAWATGDQDYDLFIYDTDDNLVASSLDAQNGPFSDSAEFIRFQAPSGGKRYYAAVQAAHTTGDYILDFFTNNGTLDQELQTAEYSLDDEGASFLGLSVGAVYWRNDQLESYSSQGPSNDGRLKPDLSAPSVVSVKSYGQEGFNGTSAAAPHVSGAVALILSAAPHFSPDQVRDYLFSNAIDLGEEGPDNLYGHGRLHLGEIPADVSPPVENTPVPTPEPTTSLSPPVVTATPGLTATTEVGIAVLTSTPQPTSTLQPVQGSLKLSGAGKLMVTLVGGLGCLGVAGLLLTLVVWLRLARGRWAAADARPATTHQAAEDYHPPAEVIIKPVPDEGIAPATNVGIQCPRCGQKNRNSAKYCRYCGLEL